MARGRKQKKDVTEDDPEKLCFTGKGISVTLSPQAVNRWGIQSEYSLHASGDTRYFAEVKQDDAFGTLVRTTLQLSNDVPMQKIWELLQREMDARPETILRPVEVKGMLDRIEKSLREGAKP